MIRIPFSIRFLRQNIFLRVICVWGQGKFRFHRLEKYPKSALGYSYGGKVEGREWELNPNLP